MPISNQDYLIDSPIVVLLLIQHYNQQRCMVFLIV